MQQSSRASLEVLASISVVIPTYNRCSRLLSTLERCRRNSEGLDIEFVVIDDGSTDETARKLEELSKSMSNLVWRTTPNGGPGRARNLGASLACKDVLLFMGDDIQPESPDFFRVHAQLHVQSPSDNLAVLADDVGLDHLSLADRYSSWSHNLFAWAGFTLLVIGIHAWRHRWINRRLAGWLRDLDGLRRAA